MPIIARVVGGAGTGKTSRLLGLMEKNLVTGMDPLDIGFVSFTKAACREAAERAGERFGIKPHVLEQQGWFRTIHSICYRQFCPYSCPSP